MFLDFIVWERRNNNLKQYNNPNNYPKQLKLLFILVLFVADWDREKLLEAWMSNAENCCQRSGVQMPTPPPSGYNAWDTLPSPKTPRTTRSTLTSPDELSLSPADEGLAMVSHFLQARMKINTH